MIYLCPIVYCRVSFYLGFSDLCLTELIWLHTCRIFFYPLGENKEETIFWEASCFSKWELISCSVGDNSWYCSETHLTNSLFVYICICLGSPYLSSLNVNSRKAAVAAWRLPRASLGDTREDTPGDITSARLTSLSNGHHGSWHINTTEASQTASLLRRDGYTALMEREMGRGRRQRLRLFVQLINGLITCPAQHQWL